MIYIDSLLTRKVKISMTECGKNINDILKHYLQPLEGKCITEGYLKRNTIKIVSYDSGKLSQHYIQFEVVFECKIALPTISQQLVCEVESNTLAGLQCKLHMEDESPFIIFLAKDHHIMPEFSDIQENEKIRVVILGQRFEINDPKISIIAVLDEMYKPEPELSPIYVPKEYFTPEKPEKPEKPKEKTVFVFKSNSADKAPGKGVNEQLVKGQSFPELSKIKDWRRMLSNFDVAEFDWSGEGVLPEPFPAKTRWNSIEHAFQGAKHWWKGHKKEALRFALSGDIGKGDGAEAQKNHKLVKIDDMAGWDDLSWKVMASAAEAKYTQNPERMRMLKATAPAELFHLTTQRGKKSDIVPFKHLEYIRTL